MNFSIFRTVVVASLLIVSVAALAAPAVAQTNGTSVTDSVSDDDSNRCAEPVVIDNNTELCDSYVSDDGTAHLVLNSTITQGVTVTDSADFMTEGVVTQRRAILRPGSPTTVRLDVDSHRGQTGVSIATNEVLYSLPLEETSSIIAGPWSASHVQTAGISGALSVAFCTLYVAFRRMFGSDETVERVA